MCQYMNIFYIDILQCITSIYSSDDTYIFKVTRDVISDMSRQSNCLSVQAWGCHKPISFVTLVDSTIGQFSTL